MRVGFIGLGNMGAGMAHNIVAKGFALCVRDLRPEPVAELQSLGATAAATNEEIGRQSDVACVAVFDDAQILATVLPSGGDGGLIAGMTAGGILVLHPTAAPSTIHLVAKAAADRGINVLDAPMTGGADLAAKAGTLTFMVGGDVAVLARARPVLDTMATSIIHVGPLGAGAAAKIINNYLGTSHVLLVREAIRMANGAGIGEEAMLRIVNTGGVGSNWSSLNWERIKTQEAGYTTGRAGMVAMATKDLKLAQLMARELGTQTPTLAAMVEHGLPDIALSGLTDNGLK